MSEAEAKNGTSSSGNPDAPKPVKKRSAVERALVWGGILLMLIVVTFEWTSQRGYGGTLSSLEEVLNSGNTIKLTEVQQHTQGYAIRTEEKTDGETVVTLKWPSLFKSYSIYIPADRDNVISSFETAESRVNPPKPVIAPATDEPSTGMGTPAAAGAPVDAPSSASNGNQSKAEETKSSKTDSQ